VKLRFKQLHVAYLERHSSKTISQLLLQVSSKQYGISDVEILPRQIAYRDRTINDKETAMSTVLTT
jgi:hypothetical protein